jgi:predicted nucleotidyltransferase
MVRNQDFREFLQSLNDHNVRYLVVGGYAVAFHGHPRYTKDLDVWVLVDPDNAQNLVAALDQFGFASVGLTEDDFLDPKTIIQLGFPPSRIDILVGLEGMEFAQCFRDRIEATLEGLKVNFISLDDLRQAKRIAGRPIDLDDIDQLSAR